MNLKFKILAYSRLDFIELKQNILKVLMHQGYIITDEKEKTISFKDDTFAFGQTPEGYRKVDSGIFHINNSHGNYENKYTYLVSLFGPFYLI